MSGESERPLRDVLREVEEADRNATPGPWTWEHDLDYSGNEPRPITSQFTELKPEVMQYAGCGSHAMDISENDAHMISVSRDAAPCLARELRAVAPLLREAGRELARHLHPDDRVLLDRLNAKADELEAK